MKLYFHLYFVLSIHAISSLPRGRPVESGSGGVWNGHGGAGGCPQPRSACRTPGSLGARSSFLPAPCTGTAAFPAPGEEHTSPRCSAAGGAEFLPCCLPPRCAHTCGAEPARPAARTAGARTLAVRYPPRIPPFSGLYVAFRSSDNLLPNVFHICSASLIQIPGRTRPAQSGALGGRKLTPPSAAHTHTHVRAQSPPAWRRRRRKPGTARPRIPRARQGRHPEGRKAPDRRRSPR